MWSSADLADVSVLARGRFLFASSIVPQATWVSLSPINPSSGLLGRFLFELRTAFAGPVPVEITSLEVSEFAELVERDVVDRTNSFPNGFIKFKDL
jgi:hypothetical protein